MINEISNEVTCFDGNLLKRFPTNTLKPYFLKMSTDPKNKAIQLFYRAVNICRLNNKRFGMA